MPSCNIVFIVNDNFARGRRWPPRQHQSALYAHTKKEAALPEPTIRLHSIIIEFHLFRGQLSALFLQFCSIDLFVFTLPFGRYFLFPTLTLHTDGQAQGYSPPSVLYESPDFGTQDLHWFGHLSISADALFLLVKNAHSWHIAAMPAVFYVFPE